MRTATTLMCAVMLAACDSAEPLSADGRWVGSQDLGFDLPFSGPACGRDYSDARRQLSGRISLLQLDLTEDSGHISGTSTFEYDFRVTVRQPGLPDCPLGGDSSGGILPVTGVREGDRLTVGAIPFAEPADLVLSPNALSGVLVVGAPFAASYGSAPDLPVTLQRVSRPTR